MRRPWTLALLAAAVLGAPVPALPAAAGPTFAQQGDDLVLANEFVVVLLDDGTPRLLVRDATNATRSYALTFTRLVEVPPQGASSTGDVVATFDLARGANWTMTQASDAQGLHVMLHREGPVEVAQASAPGLSPLPPTFPVQGNATPGNASVDLVVYLYRVPTMLRTGDASAEATSREVVIELVVGDWPWVDARDVLALEFALQGPEAATTSRPEQGPQVNVTHGDTTLGWVAWLDRVEAARANRTVVAPVAHRAPTGPAPEGAAGDLQWLVYDAAGFQGLRHDTRAGIEPTDPGGAGPPAGLLGAPGPGAAALVGVVAVVAALAGLPRRRRAA